jgi:hypothetical protein
MFYSNSHGCDIATKLNETHTGMNVYGEVWPGTGVRDCTSLGPQDFVVIMGGTNDKARDKTYKCLNAP